MNRATLLLLAALGASPLAAQVAPSAPSAITRVGWLNGCWIQRGLTGFTEERWGKGDARSMLEVGRTVRRDSLIEFEFVALLEVEGKLQYEAHPSGQPSATFYQEEISDSSIVFVNPTHDFPQRVGYARLGADSLDAWISGTRGTRTDTFHFHYVRMSCSIGTTVPQE